MAKYLEPVWKVTENNLHIQLVFQSSVFCVAVKCEYYSICTFCRALNTKISHFFCNKSVELGSRDGVPNLQFGRYQSSRLFTPNCKFGTPQESVNDCQGKMKDAYLFVKEGHIPDFQGDTFYASALLQNIHSSVKYFVTLDFTLFIRRETRHFNVPSQLARFLLCLAEGGCEI